MRRSHVEMRSYKVAAMQYVSDDHDDRRDAPPPRPPEPVREVNAMTALLAEKFKLRRI